MILSTQRSGRRIATKAVTSAFVDTNFSGPAAAPTCTDQLMSQLADRTSFTRRRQGGLSVIPPTVSCRLPATARRLGADAAQDIYG